MAFILDKNIVDMYERTRTNMLKEVLQKKTSALEGYAQVIGGCNSKLQQLPTHVGKTELNYRTNRIQKIQATELQYGKRWMKANLFEKFLEWSTDDEKFLAGLPINATTFVTQLGHAVQRVKDQVLLGTIYDDTLKDYVVMESGHGQSGAVDGSPYLAGTTGGLFGENYIGDTGSEKAELTQQAYIKDTGLSSTYTGEGTTPIDCKLTNVIPVNFTGDGSPADCGLTINKILTVRRCYEERYALSDGGALCMAITPRQKYELMKEERMQNADYGFQALRTGFVNELLGIKFLITDAVPLVETTSGKYVRACPVWLPEDLVYGVWENAKFHMRQPEDMIDQLLVGVTFGMGAARTREDTFISVHCDEGLND